MTYRLPIFDFKVGLWNRLCAGTIWAPSRHCSVWFLKTIQWLWAPNFQFLVQLWYRCSIKTLQAERLVILLCVVIFACDDPRLPKPIVGVTTEHSFLMNLLKKTFPLIMKTTLVDHNLRIHFWESVTWCFMFSNDHWFVNNYNGETGKGFFLWKLLKKGVILRYGDLL
jgi:hypothetical protein